MTGENGAINGEDSGTKSEFSVKDEVGGHLGCSEGSDRDSWEQLFGIYF
jgi:hypothetical protein